MENSIDKLPPELLIDIFLEALGGYAGWTFQQLHTLAQVCNRWKHLVLGTPHLWSTIQSRQHSWQNELVIKRNPSGPLMVRSDSDKWLENIAAWSRPSRWIGLEYGVRSHFSVLSRIIKSATSLQHLVLAANSRYNNLAVMITPPTGLRTLHLRAFSIPWTQLDSLRLESLWLEDLGHHGPTDDQTLNIVRSSPNLRRLVIRHYPSPIAPPAFALTEEPSLFEIEENGLIHLPHLETLILGLLPSSLMESLLWRLHIPACRTLHLPDTCGSAHFVAMSKSELPKTVRGILMAAKQIRLAYRTEDIDRGGYLEVRTLEPAYLTTSFPYHTTECSGSHFSVYLEGFGAWDDLVQTIGLKAFTGATTLVVDRGFLDAPASHAHSMGLPSIRRVLEDLEQTIDALEVTFNPLSILQYMSVPQQMASGQWMRRWPCPKLRSIDIQYVSWDRGSDRDELLQACIAVLRRSSVGTDSPAPPRQLEEISSDMSLGIGKVLVTMEEFRGVWFPVFYGRGLDDID